MTAPKPKGGERGTKRLARIEEAILDLAYWVTTKDKGILHGDEDIYQRVANVVFGTVVRKAAKPARGGRKK